MKEAAALTFMSNVHELISALAEMKSSVEAQLEEGLTPRTVKYLFVGRCSAWYGKHHAKIIASAKIVATKKSALEHISRITFSAFKSDSGLTELTKGRAFTQYVESLPRACADLGHEAVGRRVVIDYALIVALIEAAGGAAKGTAEKAKKGKTLVTTQMQQADAACERILADMPEADRHIYREQIKRADNKLTALMGLIAKK
jgi:hypothetical protein